jgi:DNA-binding beta-propeller fold protein YncE
VKIFVSYSRRDAGDFANQIHRHFSSFNYDIFTDVDDIKAGDIWSNTITSNISSCDIFVVIVTYGSLHSPHVENEVLQAQRENKKIIPCFFRNINPNKIKWGLDKIQGVEFTNEYQLARDLYSKIDIETNISSDKGTERSVQSLKTEEEVKTATTISTKNNSDKFQQEKDILQPTKERTEASPPKFREKTDTSATKPKTSDTLRFEQQKDSPQPPKGKIGKLKPSKPSEDITISISTKEEEEKRSASKTIEDVKTDAMTPTKLNIDKVEQKKEDLQPIPKGRVGALGSVGQSITSKTVDVGKTTTKPDVDKLEQKKDTSQPTLEITKDEKVQPQFSGDMATATHKNEETNLTERNSSNYKPSKGIFGASSKTVEDAKTPTTTIKSNTEDILQKKDANLPSNVNTGAIGDSIGVPTTPKYKAPEYDNNERIYTERDNSTKSQGINLKLIIIPIISVAIIGVIAGVIYFNVPPSHTPETVTLPPDTTKAHQFVTSWGSRGFGDGELGFPSGISVDSSKGYVYVADNGNNLIQKFDRNGSFITEWGSWDTMEVTEVGLNNARGISVDPSTGYVYVADTGNNLIQKFDSDGKFITKWGSNGTGDGDFVSPFGISVDPSTGYVYVIDTYNNRIQKFNSNGTFITKWGSNGTGNGEFYSPAGLSIDSSGNVYVADTSNHRIQKFDSDGNFITKWGSNGTGNGEFSSPLGISVDSSGNVYVSDDIDDRIQKFDSDGKFIAKWGNEGTEEGLFNHPWGIGVDSSTGYVYVADSSNSRIQVFDPAIT